MFKVVLSSPVINDALAGLFKCRRPTVHVLSNWKYLHEWASEKLLVKDEEAKTCGLTHPPQIE